ncbi:MAG TPA: 3-isopropylmalate dehydratase small subunit [Candidatus Thermoplasmatota archaeon]|nr:3-isopropylmalate dehydratase small subunit [Candidatus Thermoplasmatota archaeon]
MLSGPCLVLGDDVNTDVIAPGQYLTLWDELGKHVFEGLGKDHPALAARSTFVVAGRNFGSGSSREQAVMAIQQAGVKCVIAESFARIFFRNAINRALLVLEARVEAKTGDELEVDPSTGAIRNVTTGNSWTARPLPEAARRIVEDGGLIEHLNKRLERERQG